MDSDRELLELAAKAAGIEGEIKKTFGGWLCVMRKNGHAWQPMHDDGDALRLAVDLDFDIELTEDAAWAGGINSQNHQLYEWHRNCKYAATRRAIVGAAASIGASL